MNVLFHAFHEVGYGVGLLVGLTLNKHFLEGPSRHGHQTMPPALSGHWFAGPISNGYLTYFGCDLWMLVTCPLLVCTFLSSSIACWFLLDLIGTFCVVRWCVRPSLEVCPGITNVKRGG
ncbi:unnamed protein product [Prunus armeniaca]